MSTTIPSHLSVHEINQHKLDVEYKHWISRLEFFEVELEFYRRLLTSEAFSKVKGASEILDQIPVWEDENSSIQDNVTKYRNNLDLYRECEDLECDNFYLNDHEKFRVTLEQHSANMRQFKRELFEVVDASLL